jgi:hypothetical protein
VLLGIRATSKTLKRRKRRRIFLRRWLTRLHSLMMDLAKIRRAVQIILIHLRKIEN